MREPRHLTEIDSPAALQELNRTLFETARQASTPTMPEFTVATRPDAASWRGRVIFVSDGGVGSVFQGSNGTAWVSLG